MELVQVENVLTITANHDPEKRQRDTQSPEAGGSRTAHLFGKIANATSQAAGRAATLLVAVGVVVVWAVTGPLFHYSDTWQLIINTGTTVVTFLMVFLIQNSQNRDSAAIQVKLDELIRVSAVQNSFVGIEHLTDKELAQIRDKCEARAKAAAGDRSTSCQANRQKSKSRGGTYHPLAILKFSHRVSVVPVVNH